MHNEERTIWTFLVEFCLPNHIKRTGKVVATDRDQAKIKVLKKQPKAFNIKCFKTSQK